MINFQNRIFHSVVPTSKVKRKTVIGILLAYDSRVIGKVDKIEPQIHNSFSIWVFLIMLCFGCYRTVIS
ncbi:hypothetical protein DVH24_037433 [Malus domestica]|uniref:Uncharacterized protein n=1 Tax=Malus domestica TaxID=3750 RepID=A0A498HF65_MALDO|nr:hypothetical protein DVH24_037433 [Malus domestica]